MRLARGKQLLPCVRIRKSRETTNHTATQRQQMRARQQPITLRDFLMNALFRFFARNAGVHLRWYGTLRLRPLRITQCKSAL